MPEPATRRARDWLPRIAGAVVLVAYAALVANVRSFTWPALVLTAIAGTAVLVLATRRTRRSRPATTGRGLALWASLAVTVGAWELVAFFQSPRDDHPTISSMLDAGDSHRPLRAALFIAWIVLGRELTRR
jgi:lysylphosphatidylglycerol synthetase-like protein (DUF2156 family)